MTRPRSRVALAAAILLAAAGLVAPATPAAAVGPSGLQICNSPNSTGLNWVRPYFDDYQGRHWGPYLFPGDCYDIWNGSDPGPARVRLDSNVGSFFMKQYKTGHVSACNTQPIPGTWYTWDPPNDNGYRIDMDVSTSNNCS